MYQPTEGEDGHRFRDKTKRPPALAKGRFEPGDSGAVRTRDPQLRRLLLYPTELRNRSDMAKLTQLFRICNTSDRVSATDRGTSIRRPVLLPYPLSNCARPHNEKAPQRPSSASSDRPSSQRRVVRITRRKAARRSDEKRSFGPNSAKRKKNRSYRIAPDRAHTDSAKRTNGIPTRRPTVPGQFEARPAKSAPVTVFALFGNMLSKNRSHYLQNIPYTSRNDYEVTISKKTGITSSFAE